MDELSIKITLGDRVYPLTVKPEQEEYMRKASKLIAERMKVYEANYSVKDKQDLLAMCALEFAIKSLELETRRALIDESTASQLEEMERFLSQYLSKY
ncbi:MAG: cell division protein ZapA [Flavobacteriales bacterium]|nr:cell division protein ZapA [Flavobacteriales bacterium]MCZ2444568.1 cell division protein ZapA [Flavobacteriales bacterium]